MMQGLRRNGAGWGRILLRIFCGLVFSFLMLPLLVLFPISFSSGTYLRFPPPGFSLKWYARYFDDPAWIDATWRSLEIGVAPARSCRSLLGIPLGLRPVRGRFRGRKLIENGISAPMIVPPHRAFDCDLRALLASSA